MIGDDAMKQYKVDEAVLRGALDLFTNLESADAIFKPCQDKLFRQHMKSCMGAMNIQKSFAEIKAKLEGGEKVAKRTEPSGGPVDGDAGGSPAFED